MNLQNIGSFMKYKKSDIVKNIRAVSYTIPSQRGGKNHGVHEGRMLFAAIVLCKVRTNIFNDVEIYDVCK